jgi:hypothetical protein
MEALKVRVTHMTATSRSRRGLRMRLLPGLALLALLGLGTGGCEEASSTGQTDDIVNAWKQSGLMPSVFSKLEDENLKPGNCQQGKVDGLAVVLCVYTDATAAHAAHKTGLDRVGETTGVALAAEKYLLVVSDPDKADPSGRKINAVAEAFRETVVPRKAAAGEAASGAAKPAEGKGTEGKSAPSEGKQK